MATGSASGAGKVSEFKRLSTVPAWRLPLLFRRSASHSMDTGWKESLFVTLYPSLQTLDLSPEQRASTLHTGFSSFRQANTGILPIGYEPFFALKPVAPSSESSSGGRDPEVETGAIADGVVSPSRFALLVGQLGELSCFHSFGGFGKSPSKENHIPTSEYSPENTDASGRCWKEMG